MADDLYYRYVDAPIYSGYEPDYWLEKYPVTKRTPCGVWVDVWSVPKFCLNDARKRFAYPTVELAFESYVIRREKQLWYLKRDHDKIVALLERAKREGAKTENKHGTIPLSGLLFEFTP